MIYPQVLDEIVTIEKLVAGKYRGLARFGDGDFNVIRGQRDRYHKACPQLAEALATCLHRGSSQVLNCLIPRPIAQEGSLAYQRWHTYLEVNAGILPFLIDEIYGSSNISRMDSCPHLHTISWWHQVAKLWRDKDICLVRGSERSLTKEKLLGSPYPPRSVVEVACPPQDNFRHVEQIFTDIAHTGCDPVILCCGLSARPLVHRLVEYGLHAYDVGHFGLWYRNGHPIPLADCPR